VARPTSRLSKVLMTGPLAPFARCTRADLAQDRIGPNRRESLDRGLSSPHPAVSDGRLSWCPRSSFRLRCEPDDQKPSDDGDHADSDHPRNFFGCIGVEKVRDEQDRQDTHRQDDPSEYTDRPHNALLSCALGGRAGHPSGAGTYLVERAVLPVPKPCVVVSGDERARRKRSPERRRRGRRR
jgi:hypothetical protein